MLIRILQFIICRKYGGFVVCNSGRYLWWSVVEGNQKYFQIRMVK